MDNWEDIKKQILSDSDVKQIYDEMEVEYQIIGDMIALRNEKKMTQGQLAKRMGTTQSALSRFEMGKISPSVKFLKKMAKALDTRLSVRLV